MWNNGLRYAMRTHDSDWCAVVVYVFINKSIGENWERAIVRENLTAVYVLMKFFDTDTALRIGFDEQSDILDITWLNGTDNSTTSH